MAVTSQSAPGALRVAGSSRVASIPGVGRRVRATSRLATPLVLVAFDCVALGGALLVVGTTNPMALAYAPLALLYLSVAGAHRSRMTLRALDATPWLATRLAVPLLVLAPVAVLVANEAEQLLAVALVSTGLLLITRACAYAIIRAARRRSRLLESALILGAGEVGAELGRSFLEHPELGVKPVGFLDCVAGNLPSPLLGDVDQLDRLLEEFEITRVIVAFGPTRGHELVGVLRTAVTHDVDVHIVPRFFDVGVTPEGPDTDDVCGIPLYRVRRAALRAPAWFLKRFVDVAVALTVLVVAAPLLVVCALAVKLSSPGPVLFRQQRVGQGGRQIDVPKFRTLRVNYESDTQWCVDDDPRVTWIGELMRRTSIDELPQLWSVVKGDMSLVGPRPERPFFVRRFSVDVDGYSDRHRLPVGLTGWAQVHGLRGDTSIQQRARYDNQYIEHWTLWRDITIMLRSLAEVARGGRR